MMYQMPKPLMTGSQPSVTPYQHTQGQILQPPNPMSQQPAQEQQNPMMQMMQMQGMQNLMNKNQPPQPPATPGNPMAGTMPVGQQLPWQVNPGQTAGPQLPWQRPDFQDPAATPQASGGLLSQLFNNGGGAQAGGGFFPSWLTSMFM